MAIVTVDDINFNSVVLQSSVPVVVDFWAKWSARCKPIALMLEEISNEMGGKVTITELDIDESPKIAAQYGIRGVPTLLIFKAGDVVGNKVVFASKADLSSWINGAVA